MVYVINEFIRAGAYFNYDTFLSIKTSYLTLFAHIGKKCFLTYGVNVVDGLFV